MRVIDTMQTANNLFKWSFYISGVAGMIIIGGIVSIWLAIEVLAVLAGMTT
jgi:hypothetical protein